MPQLSVSVQMNLQQSRTSSIGQWNRDSPFINLLLRPSHSYLLSNGLCCAQVCLGLYGTLTEQSLGLNLTIDFSASGLNTDESKAVKNKFDREVKLRFPIVLVSTEPLPRKCRTKPCH
jgi:hypothetical protein